MNCCNGMGRIAMPGVDGEVKQCDRCGQWSVLRYEGTPPEGHRGQWSGWVCWPISARRARKIIKRGTAK